jgi:hypothetical protein
MYVRVMYVAANAFAAEIEHLEVELTPLILNEVEVAAVVTKVWRTVGETAVE